MVVRTGPSPEGAAVHSGPLLGPCGMGGSNSNFLLWKNEQPGGPGGLPWFADARAKRGIASSEGRERLAGNTDGLGGN